MKKLAWTALTFLILAATMPPQCNGGGGGSQPEPVELTQKVRPVQGGTQVDVAYWDEIEEPQNRGTCTYAVFVRDADYDSATYDKSGLLTADHCAYKKDAATLYDNLTSTGQDVWQSFEGDAQQTDRVVAWVTRRAPFKMWNEDGCQAFDDAGNSIKFCQVADALFAQLEPDEDLSDAGLANVPLSTTQVELTIDNPDDYHQYIGAYNTPFTNSRVYKIGRTTGKTRGIVIDRWNSITVKSGKLDVLRLNYGVYVIEPEDNIKMAAGGDSGSPVLYQSSSMSDDEYALVGIVVAARGSDGMMFMDPWGEIRDELKLSIASGY